MSQKCQKRTCGSPLAGQFGARRAGRLPQCEWPLLLASPQGLTRNLLFTLFGSRLLDWRNFYDEGQRLGNRLGAQYARFRVQFYGARNSIEVGPESLFIAVKRPSQRYSVLPLKRIGIFIA